MEKKPMRTSGNEKYNQIKNLLECITNSLDCIENRTSVLEDRTMGLKERIHE